MIGGWAGYVAAHTLTTYGVDHAELAIPIVCVPASINNDLPASDLCIGSDSALNSIVTDVDKIKDSAVASHRCFIVEVMGHDCGYLALMAGLATGAEQVYLPEEGISLAGSAGGPRRPADALRARGAVSACVIRSEHAEQHYTTDFVASLFTRESGGLFDVRTAILGHVQQGGAPSPFDRIEATRLASAGRGAPHRTRPRRRSRGRDGRRAPGPDRRSRRSPSSPTSSSATSNASRTPMVDGATAGPRPHGAR